jgi:DNA excision repair protein ERCC-2
LLYPANRWYFETKGQLILEEIKSTRSDLELIDEDSTPAHLVQAKLYAYLYCSIHNLKKMMVRLTYISVKKREVKTFEKQLTFKTLETFFIKTMDRYIE